MQWNEHFQVDSPTAVNNCTKNGRPVNGKISDTGVTAAGRVTQSRGQATPCAGRTLGVRRRWAVASWATPSWRKQTARGSLWDSKTTVACVLWEAFSSQSWQRTHGEKGKDSLLHGRATKRWDVLRLTLPLNERQVSFVESKPPLICRLSLHCFARPCA